MGRGLSTWGPPTHSHKRGGVCPPGSTHIYKWVLQEKGSGPTPWRPLACSPLIRAGASAGSPPPRVLEPAPGFLRAPLRTPLLQNRGSRRRLTCIPESPESTQGRSFLRLPVGYKSELRGKGFTSGATHPRRVLCSAHQTVSAHGEKDS